MDPFATPQNSSGLRSSVAAPFLVSSSLTSVICVAHLCQEGSLTFHAPLLQSIFGSILHPFSVPQHCLYREKIMHVNFSVTKCYIFWKLWTLGGQFNGSWGDEFFRFLWWFRHLSLSEGKGHPYVKSVYEILWHERFEKKPSYESIDHLDRVEMHFAFYIKIFRKFRKFYVVQVHCSLLGLTYVFAVTVGNRTSSSWAVELFVA